MPESYYVHPAADVSPRAQIGAGTRIWQLCQIREDAVIGEQCNLARCVYVDPRVRIGNRVKIANGVSIYEGVTLEDGVICGPNAVFTNDLKPRAVNPNGTLKTAEDWTITETLVREGASIGANATVVCGLTIGRWAMVGAGAVVTRDVPDHGLVYGNPARLHGFVCRCGCRLVREEADAPGEASGVPMVCPECGRKEAISAQDYALLQRAAGR
ncbi:MAG: N-acetyltransferase [Chloroflexi bacterium]|nr:N-acetyltransferase [Chloroflexota bacterium]